MEETTKTLETQENLNPDPKKEEPKKESKFTKVCGAVKRGIKNGWTKVKKPVTTVLTVCAFIGGVAIVGDAIDRKKNPPVELPEGSFTDIPEEANTEVTETEATEE